MHIPNSAGIYEIDWIQHLSPSTSPWRLYEQILRAIEGNGFSHSPNLATLGLPLYIAEHKFRSDSFLQYFCLNGQLNEFIFLSFKPLYKALNAALSQFFGVPLYYHPQLAVPGFHLFRSGPSSPYNGGGWHVDRFSATHPVVQNSCWSVTLILGSHNVEHKVDFEENTGAGKTEFSHAHRPGCLTIFRSDRSHRVSTMPADFDCCRLSLQAHIALLNGNAIAFW